MFEFRDAHPVPWAVMPVVAILGGAKAGARVAGGGAPPALRERGGR
jgi:hypothetical protein